MKKEVDSIAGQIRQSARAFPGFARATPPPSLVRRHDFDGDIRSEVAQTLIPRFFRTAVQEQKWDVVGEPHFQDLKFEDDQPISTVKADV